MYLFSNLVAAGYSGYHRNFITRQTATVSGEAAAASGGRHCGATELRGNTVREEGAADKYKHWADRAQVPTGAGGPAALRGGLHRCKFVSFFCLL